MSNPLSLFPRKAPANDAIQHTAIGPIVTPPPKPLSSSAGQYREDLVWKRDFINARLGEIADFFSQPNRHRPCEGEVQSYQVQELLAEERHLNGMMATMGYQITIAPYANDDTEKVTFLDLETERNLELRMWNIRRWDSSGVFRQAKIHRLELPNLRAAVRKEFFRNG